MPRTNRQVAGLDQFPGRENSVGVSPAAAVESAGASALTQLFVPAVKPSARGLGALFLTEPHRRVVETMLRAVHQGKPVIALIGEAGIGKTTLLHGALSRLRDQPAPRVLTFDAPPTFSSLRQALGRTGTSARTVLAIDSAEALSPWVLRYLALKAKGSLAAGSALHVILVGRPALADALQTTAVARLSGTPPVVLPLEPMTLADACRYVEQRVVMLSGYPARQVMTAAAVRIIAQRGGGVPGEMDRRLDQAVTQASKDGEGWITGPAARIAGTPETSAAKRAIIPGRALLYAAVTAGAAVLVAVAVPFVSPHHPPPDVPTETPDRSADQAPPQPPRLADMPAARREAVTAPREPGDPGTRPEAGTAPPAEPAVLADARPVATAGPVAQVETTADSHPPSDPPARSDQPPPDSVAEASAPPQPSVIASRDSAAPVPAADDSGPPVPSKPPTDVASPAPDSAPPEALASKPAEPMTGSITPPPPAQAPPPQTETAAATPTQPDIMPPSPAEPAAMKPETASAPAAESTAATPPTQVASVPSVGAPRSAASAQTAGAGQHPMHLAEPAAPSGTVSHADPHPPSALPPATIATLIRRGEAMRATGDISAARLLFDRAAEAGNAQAATEAGRLRDQAYLAKLGAIGVAADSRVAASWYRRGVTLGDTEASGLLQRLEEAAR